MESLRLVTKYTNMPQDRVLQMPHDLFLLNVKYAFIDEKMQTEEGREYLKKAERLNITTPDFSKLQKMDSYKRE